jgi:hypothetical protein
MHAYRFTHFIDEPTPKTSEQLSSTVKVKLLFTGVSNPKPKAKMLPKQAYEVIFIKIIKDWNAGQLKLRILRVLKLFSMAMVNRKPLCWTRQKLFLQMGYSTLLVDFMGAGGSEKVQTTIGCNKHFHRPFRC